MKQVYTARNPAEAHLVVGLLDAKGIEAVVKGEGLSTLQGDIPVSETWPTIWVIDDEYDKALELVRQYESLPDATEDNWNTWRCPQCGEAMESQFTECWKCGTARPSSS